MSNSAWPVRLSSERSANLLTGREKKTIARTIERTEYESHGARQGLQGVRVGRDADPPKDGGDGRIQRRTDQGRNPDRRRRAEAKFSRCSRSLFGKGPRRYGRSLCRNQ